MDACGYADRSISERVDFNLKKIGILYICTGEYSVFWKDFYTSFEKNFLPNTEKHYFVFTDTDVLFDCENNKRIHIKKIISQPWPLPTLLKYHTFLQYEDELRNMDYLYQSNANILCEQEVTEEEFLNLDQKQPLFFNVHPGYINTNLIYIPFDRNAASKAYVSYIKGKKYVFGAMNGGLSGSYLKMIKEIMQDINYDLKNNYIAKWHDESYVNHYVAYHNNYILHSPAYCYPVGFDVNFKRKIVGVSKKDKININKIKENKCEKHRRIIVMIKKTMNRFSFLYFFIKDKILYINNKVR